MAKLLYFGAFLCVVIAFVFHATAMGHHHWKHAFYRENNSLGFNFTSIGLFTRCTPSTFVKSEVCVPNLYPRSDFCFSQGQCLPRAVNDTCHCDFLPSTKGIAACAIIGAIGLGLALILLFMQSINESQSRILALLYGVLPLVFIILAFIFILIALILVGSYLSRDMMHLARYNQSKYPSNDCSFVQFSSILLALDLDDLRDRVERSYDVRIGWASGLEIVALVMSFFSLILYGLFMRGWSLEHGPIRFSSLASRSFSKYLLFLPSE